MGECVHGDKCRFQWSLIIESYRSFLPSYSRIPHYLLRITTTSRGPQGPALVFFFATPSFSSFYVGATHFSLAAGGLVFPSFKEFSAMAILWGDHRNFHYRLCRCTNLDQLAYRKIEDTLEHENMCFDSQSAFRSCPRIQHLKECEYRGHVMSSTSRTWETVSESFPFSVQRQARLPIPPSTDHWLQLLISEQVVETWWDVICFSVSTFWEQSILQQSLYLIFFTENAPSRTSTISGDFRRIYRADLYRKSAWSTRKCGNVLEFV